VRAAVPAWLVHSGAERSRPRKHTTRFAGIGAFESSFYPPSGFLCAPLCPPVAPCFAFFCAPSCPSWFPVFDFLCVPLCPLWLSLSRSVNWNREVRSTLAVRPLSRSFRFCPATRKQAWRQRGPHFLPRCSSHPARSLPALPPARGSCAHAAGHL
jgi:hypothetical protein